MTRYFDHAATTPMSAALRSAYADALAVVGNPSSIHSAGQSARAMLEGGRDAVAASLGVDPMEIVLTSGGTESINLAIKGMFWQRQEASGGRARRILLTRAEHHATLDSALWLERRFGAELEWLPVDAEGRLLLDGDDGLRAALQRDPDTIALVTTLWANNEVGTLQPVEAIIDAARVAGVPSHVDAVAAYGQVPIDARALGASALSVSAHKIGGPVGVGALVLSREAQLEPLLHGGDQQRARSGTMDAAGAHVFGLAASQAHTQLAAHAAAVAALRDRLVAGILGADYGTARADGRAAIPGAELRGAYEPAGRLTGNAHVTFAGCQGDSLLYLLDELGFAVSTGSACQAGVPEPSHVLLAMGVDERTARGPLRFTLGSDTTADDIDALLEVLPGVVEQARTAGLS